MRKETNVNRISGRNISAWMLALALLASIATVNMVQADGHEEGETVADVMSVINDNYKQLRRTARRKNFDDESVKQVAAMIAASVEAMHMPFPMAEKLSGEAKTKAVIGYRKEMAKMINALMDLEFLILEGKMDEAAEAVDNLNILKKEGHDKYVEE